MKNTFVMLVAMLAVEVASLAADAVESTKGTGSWSSKTAAAYLDQRFEWWTTWPSAARDHDTFCVSCHTAVPYSLGRPALRSALAENGPSPIERKLIGNVAKRVRIWSEALPFYSDEKNGAPKTAEARGTESVLNALILSTYDVHEGKFGDDTRKAFDNMWALQLKTGDAMGAFTWLNFHNEPWEADDSQFWGATLAAIAAGNTPQQYRAEPQIKANLALLASYLGRNASSQSLLNKAVLLWAAAGMPGILQPSERSAIVNELYAKQQSDGGWSTSSIVIANWKRRDSTPLGTNSDGYGTGLATLALEKAGVSAAEPHLKNALAWLRRNQDRETGRWVATSLNKQRDPASDAGRFMSDAATAYSVLALTGNKQRNRTQNVQKER
jgi:squalene-hopene/tetraprenyl-beta-curcumene cyclase